MKFATFASALAVSAFAAASGWNHTTTTYWLTTTDYVTYCPEETTVTITTCSDHKCNPEVITVLQETTITVTGECVIGVTTPPAGHVTTDYVTVCPEATTFTVTTCDEHKKCGAHVVTVEEATTVTVTGECYVPTTTPESHPSPTPETHTTAPQVSTDVTVLEYVTYCPEPTTLVVTKCENDECSETSIPVENPGTVTVSSVVVPTKTTVADVSTVLSSSAAPSSASPSEFEGGAGRREMAMAAVAAGWLYLL